MSIIKKIKSFYKKADTPDWWEGSYYFNKTIFKFCFGLILLLLGVALISAPSGSLAYAHCPLGSITFDDMGFAVDGCNNPFFNRCNQDVVPCDKKILLVESVYGAPFVVPFFHKYFVLWVVIILLGGFLFNHFKYNVKELK